MITVTYTPDSYSTTTFRTEWGGLARRNDDDVLVWADVPWEISARVGDPIPHFLRATPARLSDLVR